MAGVWATLPLAQTTMRRLPAVRTGACGIAFVIEGAITNANLTFFNIVTECHRVFNIGGYELTVNQTGSLELQNVTDCNIAYLITLQPVVDVVFYK